MQERDAETNERRYCGRSGSRKPSIRALLEGSQRGDEDALVGLFDLLSLDITKVLSTVLSDRQFLEEVKQDIRVRLFVYLRAKPSRFSVPDGVSDEMCGEYLRRWSTNMARNWGRLINEYGIIETHDRWTFPRWAMGPSVRLRRGMLPTFSFERDFVAYDGESSEQCMDRLALKASISGQAVFV